MHASSTQTDVRKYGSADYCFKHAPLGPERWALMRRALLIARGLDDLSEAARIKAGATDEGAIDVCLVHELACVFWFNAPAVLNADAFGGRVVCHFVQSVANKRVGFLCLSGRGVAAGGHGPDRVIGNPGFLQFLRT